MSSRDCYANSRSCSVLDSARASADRVRESLAGASERQGLRDDSVCRQTVLASFRHAQHIFKALSHPAERRHV